MPFFDIGMQDFVIAAADGGHPVLEMRQVGHGMIFLGLTGSGLAFGSQERVIAGVVGKDHVAFAAEEDRAHWVVRLHERKLVPKTGLGVRVPRAVFVGDRSAVCKLVRDGHVRGRRAVIFMDELAAHGTHVRRMAVQTQSPAEDVQFVNGLVGETAAAEFQVPVPAPVPELAVGPFRFGAEPLVPVQPCRCRAGSDGAQVGAEFIVQPACHIQIADSALFEFLDAFPNVGARPVLCPVLDHAIVLAGGRHHLASFEQVVAARLLDVHIFARLTGPNRRQRMPAVSQAIADGIDGLVVEHLPHVRIGGQLLALEIRIEFRGILDLAFIAVTDGDDFDVVARHLGQCSHVGSHPSAQAQQPDTNSVVGAQPAVGNGGSGKRDGAGCCGCAFEELTSVRF